MRMLIYELSNDIVQRKIQQEFTKMKVSKNKKSFFFQTSAAIAFSSSKFEMCMHEIYMEGSMSESFEIGPSFFFRKCRN